MKLALALRWPSPASTAPAVAADPARAPAPRSAAAAATIPLGPRTLGLAPASRAFVPGTAVGLRATQASGPDAKRALELLAARHGIEARLAQGGFEPYPLGEATTEVVPMGTSFAVRFSGGSNYDVGSIIAWDPVHKTAHHIQHGFSGSWQAPRPELGGRIAGDALGFPLEAEVSEGSTSRQQFQHGTLRWSPDKGVWVEPADLFTARAAALFPRAPAEWLTTIPYSGEAHSYFFVEWARKQVEHNAAIGQVHQQVRTLLESGERPQRLGELLDVTRGYAEKAVGIDPRVPPETRAHLVNLTTLVALAAHALKNDGTDVIRGFPVFMGDGRSVDAGMDKSWHFTNHAMMAYAMRFDAEHGSGQIAKDFAQAVEHADATGVAQRVARTYHERRGALGAFVGQVVHGPPDDVAGPYAPRPIGLSPAAQQAFDLAVRLGDAHEVQSSGDSFTVALDDVGDTRARFDPLAPIVSRFSRVWGLQDHGVSRDLTANRLGAELGVEWFEAPGARPAFPFDAGPDEKGAYAAARPIPYDLHLAEELMMLRKLGGAPQEGPALLAKALGEVRALGKDAAQAAVREQLEATVDALIASGDHDRLAKLYGNFSVRHQRWGERLKGFDETSSYFAPEASQHAAWATWSLANGKAADVKQGFLSRLDQAAASFG